MGAAGGVRGGGCGRGVGRGAGGGCGRGPREGCALRRCARELSLQHHPRPLSAPRRRPGSPRAQAARGHGRRAQPASSAEGRGLVLGRRGGPGGQGGERGAGRAGARAGVRLLPAPQPRRRCGVTRPPSSSACTRRPRARPRRVRPAPPAAKGAGSRQLQVSPLGRPGGAEPRAGVGGGAQIKGIRVGAAGAEPADPPSPRPLSRLGTTPNLTRV